MDIYIHIGHGKTGTSAIQSFLATNRELLIDNNIVYPEHSSFREASLGRISSGNGMMLLDGFNFNDEYETYLFSNESLYVKLQKKERLKDFISSLPSKPILICYTRDLFDYFISAWGQYIKRGRGTSSIEDYAKNFRGFYRILANYIEWADELQYNLIVRNYSRHSTDIIEDFLSIVLGKNSEFLNKALFSNKVVNRSLTNSEYKIQQLFNIYFDGISSNFISDVLVNKLPEIKSDKPLISKNAYNSVVQNSLEDIQLINESIPSSEAINIAKVEDITQGKSSDIEQYCFTEDQLKVIVESISRRIKKNEI